MSSIADTTKNIDLLFGSEAALHTQALRVEALGDGFSVEYPILSLDAPDQASFNFCSSIYGLYFASQAQSPKRQTLLSQEAFHYLKGRGMHGNFLPCPYFRPISLGSLSVELLPSGQGCGSSFLRVQKGLESLFYAHNWTSFESKALRAHATKESDTLLLRLAQSPLAKSRVTAKKELQRCYELIQKIAKVREWVIVSCSSFGQTNVLLHELCARQLPCYLDGRSHKMLMSMKTDSPKDDVPNWVSHPKKLPTSLTHEIPGVILLTKENFRSIKWAKLPDAIWFWVGDDLEAHLAKGPNWLAGITFSEVFPVSLCPDLSEVLQLVQEVKPSKTLVAGEGADLVVSALNRQGIHALPAVPKQLTLF